MSPSKRRSLAYKKLKRDSRGRWVSAKISKEMELTPKKIEERMDKIKQDFEQLCPRCAGDLKNHWIRAGPQKRTQVLKCGTCNYWLPISS